MLYINVLLYEVLFLMYIYNIFICLHVMYVLINIQIILSLRPVVLNLFEATDRQEIYSAVRGPPMASLISLQVINPMIKFWNLVGYTVFLMFVKHFRVLFKIISD